jgi:hypothetical protein
MLCRWLALRELAENPTLQAFRDYFWIREKSGAAHYLKPGAFYGACRHVSSQARL